MTDAERTAAFNSFTPAIQQARTAKRAAVMANDPDARTAAVAELDRLEAERCKAFLA